MIKFNNYSQICLKQNVTLIEELKLVGSIRNLLLNTKYTGITTTTEVFVITAIVAAVTVAFQEVQLVAIVTDMFSLRYSFSFFNTNPYLIKREKSISASDNKNISQTSFYLHNIARYSSIECYIKFRGNDCYSHNTGITFPRVKQLSRQLSILQILKTSKQL